MFAFKYKYYLYLENTKDFNFEKMNLLELTLASGKKFEIDFQEATKSFKYGDLIHRV